MALSSSLTWVHPPLPDPVCRYFFPRDFELREGGDVNPFYQYFDVGVGDLEVGGGVKLGRG